MLSPEDNAFLTRVGPGTPMGELWRRFWLPALLPRELPEPDCPPVRVRLLGEDLVAFRDTTGKVGVVAENCPHRGASLFFGRNEEKGLRCVYHGWKFDTSGACVDMPNEPPESNFKQKVKVTAYSAAEHGGIIWIYLGPAHLSPELPKFEWCDVPDSHRYVGKWLYDANFIQPMEGELDSSHLAFLHRRWELTDGMAQLARNRAPNPIMDDPSPRLTMRQTDGGFTYGARRHTP